MLRLKITPHSRSQGREPSIDNMIKPSEQCKSAGLKSLAELASITGKPVQTLINWHREEPQLFEVVVWGAAVKKMTEKPNSPLVEDKE